MSFGLYAAGYAIVIVGLVYAAHLMRISPHWILVGAIVMVGIGLLSAVKATRPKDPA
jgi:MFS superfamily sulfate permease-like transporter